MLNVDQMSQYNKLSSFQYARFQILPIYHRFGLFGSAGSATMHILDIVKHVHISYDMSHEDE